VRERVAGPGSGYLEELRPQVRQSDKATDTGGGDGRAAVMRLLAMRHALDATLPARVDVSFDSKDTPSDAPRGVEGWWGEITNKGVQLSA